jgi:hypothetical protein
MVRFVLVATLAAVLSVLTVVIPHNDASAQQRATCSQARSACGTQRICRERYQECMRTGCWAARLVKRCGYTKE